MEIQKCSTEILLIQSLSSHHPAIGSHEDGGEEVENSGFSLDSNEEEDYLSTVKFLRRRKENMEENE